jgi:hypothetical protein
VTSGTSFHGHTRLLAHQLLIASPTVRDLLFSAKHLFVAAMWCGTDLASRGLEGGANEEERGDRSMGNLLFWLGIGAAQKGAGSNKRTDRRHWVISFVVGILLALLIAAGMFLLLVHQQ